VRNIERILSAMHEQLVDGTTPLPVVVMELADFNVVQRDEWGKLTGRCYYS